MVEEEKSCLRVAARVLDPAVASPSYLGGHHGVMESSDSGLGPMSAT